MNRHFLRRGFLAKAPRGQGSRSGLFLGALASSRAATRRAGQCTILLITLLVTAPALAAGAAIHVQVDGLACPFCAYGLEKKLKPLPGVTAVRIDYQAGWVELTLGDGATLEKATIRRAVRAAGFTPRAIHRVAPDEADLGPGAGEP